MAASTVAYTDTTGNRDYLGMIANQIGKRLTEASDMASDERAFAEKKAEEGGTSLSEAGIGKGYFFKRALGSRFGGDAIARTKGRMGMGGAGTDPTGNFRSRFRGGFDYNVTNELSSMPLSNALTAGLRGVESGLISISKSLGALASGMDDLARAQQDAAKQAILNGAFMQAFLNHMQREASRQRARSEERSLETGRLLGGGGGRNMINVTPSGGGRRRGIGKGFDTFQTGLKAGTNPKSAKLLKSAGAATGLKSGRTITKKLAQVGGKTAPKLLASATKVTGDVIPISKVISAGIKASDTNAIKAYAKSGVTGAGKTMKTMAGYEALANALREQDADFFAMSQMEEGTEEVFRNLADNNIARLQNSDDAYRAMAAYKNGSLDGVARSTDEAISMFKYTYGDAEYAKYFGKNAAKPLKTAVKGTVTEQVIKQTSKQAAKITAKNIGKSIWKKIPIIAGIAGIGFGIQRALEGDLLGAGLEITSGLMGATGVAAKGSLAIDGYLLARDLGLTPLATGAITNGPVNALIGERGREGVFPLEGALGKKTFKMFGEGIVDAKNDNEGEETKLLALGQKRYFESMNGWKSFGEAIVDSFTNFKDNVGDFISDVNPFNQENLSNINNSGAANSLRNVIGSEVGDGFIGPKWLGIKNPFADEQANALNNNSAQMSGNGVTSITTINNYNNTALGNNGGSSDDGSSSMDAFSAYNHQFSLASK